MDLYLKEPRRQEDFATESLRRHDDYNRMEKTMKVKVEEVLKNDHLARQQAQNEIKQMAKKDLEERGDAKPTDGKRKHGVQRGKHWSGSGRLRHLC